MSLEEQEDMYKDLDEEEFKNLLEYGSRKPTKDMITGHHQSRI